MIRAVHAKATCYTTLCTVVIYLSLREQCAPPIHLPVQCACSLYAYMCILPAKGDERTRKVNVLRYNGRVARDAFATYYVHFLVDYTLHRCGVL